jgi:hypothetical protein
MKVKERKTRNMKIKRQVIICVLREGREVERK